MIHVIQVNENDQAKAWFAFDEYDLMQKVKLQYAQDPSIVIYQEATPNTLLSENKEIAETLADEYGWDTKIYRADFMFEQGQYQTEPVSELRACVAAIASSKDFRIYPDDDTAADALDSDLFFKSREGFNAGLKLREQLVSMEVIAEDF